MATREISEPVQRFVRRSIHSAAQLEILLLLRGAPDHDWSVAEVTRAHAATPVLAKQVLEHLVMCRLVARTGTERPAYRYSAGKPDIEMVDALAAAYGTRRVAVLALIFSPSS